MSRTRTGPSSSKTKPYVENTLSLDEALGATVAAFAVELNRELAAAARALARYVDDLEGELAAADEGAVR